MGGRDRSPGGGEQWLRCKARGVCQGDRESDLAVQGEVLGEVERKLWQRGGGGASAKPSSPARVG